VRWWIVLVLCATLGLHNGSRVGPASLLDELRVRFGVDYAGAGNLIGAYTLTYGFAQLSAGFLTDRFGSRRLLLVGLSLMTFGAGLFAVATDYMLALVGRFVMGVAGGFLYTPTIAYCLAAFDRAARGRVMAFAQSGTGAGQVLSIAVLPLLFGVVGLTGAFMAYPLLAVALLITVWRFLPTIPQERKAAGQGMRAVARYRDFWLLLIGFAFIGMLAQSSVLNWVPTYLRGDYGWTSVQAGLAGGLVAAGILVFPTPFGLLVDRIRSRRAVMLIGCAIGLVGWTVLLVAADPYVAIAGALLVSASMAATLPIQAIYATERFAAVGAGTAIGLVNTGGQIAGSLAGPVYGAMLDTGLGFQAVWASTIILGLLRTGAVLLLRDPQPLRSERSAGPPTARPARDTERSAQELAAPDRAAR
jgi:predicted MFS family arabinose efflux permease